MKTPVLSHPSPTLLSIKTISPVRRTPSPFICSFPKSRSVHGLAPSRAATVDAPTCNDGETNACRHLLNVCYYANSPYMKGGYGAFGGGTLTLQPAPLDLSTTASEKLSPLLDTGGYGGDNGRISGVGGGGGGGDDDEYNWNNIDPDDDGGGDDEDLGIFRLRSLIPEIFDKEVMDAVLSEWMKTMKDLPLGLKQAYTIGMLSSAQVTRFLCFNARPTLSRFLCRTLPEGLSRDFNGKMIADPSLPYKLLLEVFTSLGFSVWWDSKHKGIENMKKEWNLVLTNAVSVAACNVFVVWSLAPCYRYGDGFGFQWLNNFIKLPNNVFEGSYRFREFNLQKRGLSYCYKAVNLFALGVAARMAQIGLSSLSAKDKDNKERRLMVANICASAVGAGLFMGLYSNLRYQLLCGIDRGLVGYFDVMGVPLCLGSAMRILNSKIGAQSLCWVGNEEAFPLVHSFTKFKQDIASNLSDLKSVIASGIGLIDAFTKFLTASNKGKPKRRLKKKMAAVY